MKISDAYLFIDWPWSHDVRRYGAPCRIYLHTRRWHYMIGLFPWVKGQAWFPETGWSDPPVWRWIVKSPANWP